MTTPAPAQPKIYHIVHVDNLLSIVADGCLWSDRVMAQRQGVKVIGMGSIKQRRLGLPVACHPGTCVGDYVPFYFCSRSVMQSSPWHLVERIGVCAPAIGQQAANALQGSAHRPTIEVRRDWYY